MKVIISKDKKGKVVYKYKSENGLIFNYKNNCETYNRKWMTKRLLKEADTI